MASSATPSSACFIGDVPLTHGCHMLAKPASSCDFHCKDPSKRKRVNRSAKLKQCKRDARREQWLSQGKQQQCQNISSETPVQIKASIENEEHETVIGCLHSDHPSEKDQHCDSAISSSETDGAKSKANAADRRDMHKLSDSENSMAPTRNSVSDCSEGTSSPKSSEDKSPKSKITKLGRSFESGRERQDRQPGMKSLNSTKKRDDTKSSKRVSAIVNRKPDLSDSSNLTSCRLGSGKEGNNNNHDSEDDWEAAADALDLGSSPSGKSSHSESADYNIIASIHKLLHFEQIEENTTKIKMLDCGNKLSNTRNEKLRSLSGKAWRLDDIARPSSLPTRNEKLRSLSGKAWRPDDIARPSSLPTLIKQQSFPVKHSKVWVPVQKPAWVPPPAPSHCPICTEELDSTDASFIPCLCGFRLCLFCHHRIMLENGRCPGCRKSYDKDIMMKLSSLQNDHRRM